MLEIKIFSKYDLKYPKFVLNNFIEKKEKKDIKLCLCFKTTKLLFQT